MIQNSWPRIAGMHYAADGTVAVVWMALERAKDRLHVYDCEVFPRDLPIVITYAIQGRGKTIPVAWAKAQEEFAESLRECGVNMTVDAVDATDLLLEAKSRELNGRMRSERFKVDKGCKKWLKEYNEFYREGNEIPRDSSPLMAATLIASASVDQARVVGPAAVKKINYPARAII